MVFECYAVLWFAVVSLGILAFLLWRRTRSLAFPVGLALLYFGTLHGAWSILEDKTGGDSQKHYAYLEVKMFPVAIDADYLATLVLYTAFLLSVAVTVFMLARAPNTAPSSATRPLHLNHWRLMALCAGAGVFSYLIIRDRFAEAMLYNIPGYQAIRSGSSVPRLYTVYQELNRVALLPLSIGLATIASGQQGRYLVGPRSARAGLGYILLLSALYAYCLLLGNKNELLSASLLGALFYLANTPHPQWARLAAIGFAAIVGVGFVDVARAISFASLSGNVSMKDLLASVGVAAGSNEQFSAHFSLYGILHYHLPLTYGSSFLSLAASVVPRALWPDRPKGIYGDYATNVGAMAGQGYTIHHAAGWYLNFGIVGLLLGGVLLGLMWVGIHNYSLSPRPKAARFWRVLAALAPSGFVSGLFVILRAGPEGYKALMVDGLLIPAACIAASASWMAASDPLRSPYTRDVSNEGLASSTTHGRSR